MSAILGCIVSHSRSIYFKNFPGEHAPDPPRTLAPAARAKTAFGNLFSTPNRKNAARSLLFTAFFSVRYQDVHNQSYIMVKASGRWLGVRLDLLTSIFIGAVSLAAVLVSQDAGRCTCRILNLRDYHFENMLAS